MQDVQGMRRFFELLPAEPRVSRDGDPDRRRAKDTMALPSRWFWTQPTEASSEHVAQHDADDTPVWYSPRLGHDMGVARLRPLGAAAAGVSRPATATNGSYERHGLIDAIGDFIDAGRVKVFCVGSNNHESFLNSSAHPFHRSWRQRMFDEYIRDEVIPFVHSSCQTPGIPIATIGRVARRLSRRQHALSLSRIW